MTGREILKGIQEDPSKKIRISTEMAREIAVEELGVGVEEEELSKEDVGELIELSVTKMEEVRGIINRLTRKTIKTRMIIEVLDLKKEEARRRIHKKRKIHLRKPMMIRRIILTKKGFLIEGINLKNIIKKKGKKITMINWIDIPKIVLMKKEIINLKTIIKKKVII